MDDPCCVSGKNNGAHSYDPSNEILSDLILSGSAAEFQVEQIQIHLLNCH
jgi:hypothetical protein